MSFYKCIIYKEEAQIVISGINIFFKLEIQGQETARPAAGTWHDAKIFLTSWISHFSGLAI